MDAGFCLFDKLNISLFLAFYRAFLKSGGFLKPPLVLIVFSQSFWSMAMNVSGDQDNSVEKSLEMWQCVAIGQSSFQLDNATYLISKQFANWPECIKLDLLIEK